jgi:hypothetical protein
MSSAGAPSDWPARAVMWPVQTHPAGGPGWDYVRGMASSSPFDARQDRPKLNGDLQDVAHGVHQEFDQHLDPRAVDECLDRISAKFVDAKVRAFVPLLVRRYASDELHKRVLQT